jgi:hypothetical protein
MTRKTLDSGDALRFFARLKQDGNFHGRLSIDEGAVEVFAKAWNSTAGSGGADEDVGEAADLMCRFAAAEPQPISVAPAEFTALGHTGRLDTNLQSKIPERSPICRAVAVSEGRIHFALRARGPGKTNKLAPSAPTQ